MIPNFSESCLALSSPPLAREAYVMARSAPISAQPRAASMPMPMGPEAPVTTTTLPLRLKRSWMESAAGTSMGMVTVLVGSRLGRPQGIGCTDWSCGGTIG